MSWQEAVFSTVHTAFSATESNSIELAIATTPMNNPPASGTLILTDSFVIAAKTKHEIIDYTGLSSNGSYFTISGITRGTQGTTASAFSVGDIVYQGATAAEFNKLDGIDDSANNYNHPAVNHLPAGGTVGQILKNQSPGQGGWSAEAFTLAYETKLDGIETAATADQTAAQIKSAYEGQLNTNAFTDDEKTLLATVTANATPVTNANVTGVGALMDSEVTNLAFIKALTTADGVNIAAIIVWWRSLNSHYLTDCGQTGNLAPTPAQFVATYQAHAGYGQAYIRTAAAQVIKIITPGDYIITAKGAGGTDHDGALLYNGAKVQGTVTLSAGDYLHCVVGQPGTKTGNVVSGDGSAGANGGSSFVGKSTTINGTITLYFKGAGGPSENDTDYNSTPSSVGANSQLANYAVSWPSSFIGASYTRGETSLGGYGGGLTADDAATPADDSYHNYSTNKSFVSSDGTTGGSVTASALKGFIQITLI